MTLVLTNTEIEALLPMADCLPAVEVSYRGLGEELVPLHDPREGDRSGGRRAALE